MTPARYGVIGSQSVAARQITDELDRAAAEFLELHRMELEFIRDVPEGMPIADAQDRILRGMKELRSAFKKYQSAVKRYRGLANHYGSSVAPIK